MIAVSSLRNGIVSSALKEGSGSASMATSGNFSGSEDLEYIVEIDSIAGGAEVGQATFRWSDGSGGWNASGVTTPAAATELNNGVKIAFTSGAGADFVVGDRWYFKALNLFNAGQMIDLNRDQRYRSAALGSPNTITVDLGSAQEIKALIVHDHNLTSGATILLEGDDADTFDSDGGNPQFSEAVDWNEEKIVHYLSAAATRRYWRVSITDAANPDNYIEIGELFLGGWLELSQNYVEGFSEETEIIADTNETPYGVGRTRFYNTRLTFEFEFGAMAAADVASMKSLIAAIADRTAGTIKPFWFNKDAAAPNDSWIVTLASLPVRHNTRAYYDMPLTFEEVLRSV